MSFRGDDESPVHGRQGMDDSSSTTGSGGRESGSKPAAADSGKKPAKTPSSSAAASPMKKRPWRKPKDMPKRPLSAYNLFFADERKKLLAAREAPDDYTTGISRDIFSNTSPAPAPQAKKLGFAGLARTVAAKWKTLDPIAKSTYEKQANVEKARYKAQMKEYNEQRLRSQQQATMGSGMDPASLQAAWPAMPQTIASLGNIYDSAAEQTSQRTSLDYSHGGASMGDAASSGLVLPKGQYYGGPQDVYAPAPGMDLGYPPARQQQYDASHRSSWAAPPTASMINWNDERGQAKRLSSPGNISILAEELGQEQVDFFLNSLKDEDEEEEKKKRPRDTSR